MRWPHLQVADLEYFTSQIEDVNLILDHRSKESDFSRTGLIGPVNLVKAMVLKSSHSCMSVARFLRKKLNIYSPKGGSVSRSGASQARKKILPSLFETINSKMLDRHSSKPKNIIRWKGHQICAIDATSLITNKSIYDDFLGGLSEKERQEMEKNHPHTYNEEAQLHAVTLHDTLNDLCLDIHIDFKSIGERELATRFGEKIKSDMIVVFDRGYPASWFFMLMENIGCKYLIRLKKDHSNEVKAFYESGNASQIITLNLKKTDIEKLEDSGCPSGIEATFKVRLVRVEYEGCVRIFATNLTVKEASTKDINELYGLRWEIEKSYGTLKTYLKLEGWCQYTKQGVLTDVAIKIMLYNLSSILSQQAKHELIKSISDKESTWEFKVCKAYAIDSLKEDLEIIFCIIKISPCDRLKLISRLLKAHTLDLLRNLSSIIKNRKVKRKDDSKPNRRTQMNRKASI